MSEQQEAKEIKVDDDLYSRSILTYGLDTLKKLSQIGCHIKQVLVLTSKTNKRNAFNKRNR